MSGLRVIRAIDRTGGGGRTLTMRDVESLAPSLFVIVRVTV
jgi:hypothetical protein